MESAHFLPFKMGKKMDWMAKLDVSEIVRLHGAPLSIVFIEIVVSSLDFGPVRRKLWERSYISTLLIILRQMVR